MKKISLEISLKPFCGDPSDQGIAVRSEQILRQWERLWARGEAVQFMLWTGDGSELLDYAEDFDDTFDYARYLGSANPNNDKSKFEPQELATLHDYCRFFMENPPVWTYGKLRNLVLILKQTFRRLYGREAEVGTTFDPGPEFAYSEFKYQRHPEVLGDMLGGNLFICCCNHLHADKRRYAAYPDGIPEGTSFGTFFGSQTQCFLTDMGFDFIWFSNGLGFGVDTWSTTGSVYDGKEFHPENADTIREKVLEFWRDFRQTCPSFRIETRGTNLSTGIDLASDGLPLREIYRTVPNLEPPPNSPWAALDADFGLELTGMMSHIAELPPGKGYPFRFYTHDPWWLNSPWLDRYDRMPHDIYLPLACTRLNASGIPEGPSQLNILSVDDSWGNTPDQVPNEVIPYLSDALKTSPDQPGPIVWIYPFEEYHELLRHKQTPEAPFSEDWQVIGVINDGFPMNTVVSTTNFLEIPIERLAERVLVAPTSVADSVLDHLFEYAEAGTTIIFYGCASNEKIRAFFELEETTSIEGEMEIPGKGKVRFNPLWAGGPLNTILRPGATTRELYVFEQNGERRPALLRKDHCFWIRSVNPFSAMDRLPERLPAIEYFDTARFFREALNNTGWNFDYQKFAGDSPSPRLTVRVHDNAFYYAGFGTDSTIVQNLSTPDGVPLFRGRDVIIENGLGKYPVEKVCNLEARIFVRQSAAGVLRCKEETHENIGQCRRISVTGLQDAEVVVRPSSVSDDILFLKDKRLTTLYAASDYEAEKHTDAYGVKYVLRGITGTLAICWGEKQKEFLPSSMAQENINSLTP